MDAMTKDADTYEFDLKLLEILICPISRAPLEWDAARQLLISKQAGLAYQVRDGIPVMLPDEALPWPEEAAHN